MKYTTSICFLTLLCFSAFGQKNTNNFEKQTGKLEVLWNDSLKKIELKTEEAVLYIDREVGFASDSVLKDSITGLELLISIFKNGMLKPDTILKQFKHGVTKMDSSDQARYKYCKMPEVINIERKIPGNEVKALKHKKALFFLVAVDFLDQAPDSNLDMATMKIISRGTSPSIHDFILILQSDYMGPITGGNVDKVMREAKLINFYWSGDEI